MDDDDEDENIFTVLDQMQQEQGEREEEANTLDHGNTEISNILFKESQGVPEKVKAMPVRIF